MFTKTLFAAMALAITTSAAHASLLAAPMTDAPQTVAAETYDVADTRGMDNRQDRRSDRQTDRDGRQDNRQDCRQSEGVGHDKRDCKQDGRQAG